VKNSPPPPEPLPRPKLPTDLQIDGSPEPEIREESGSDSAERISEMSTLQLLDLIQIQMQRQGAETPVFHLLRTRIEELEETQYEAITAIEQLNEAVDQLRAPALKIGTLLELREDGTALALSGGEYLCKIGPDLTQEALETGMRVTLNEAFVITSTIGIDDTGPVVKVSEVLGRDRLRVHSEHSMSDMVVRRSTLLRKEKIEAGQELKLDGQQRLAVEIVASKGESKHTVSGVPETPWEAIGGQDAAVKAIRDAVELPYMHGDVFKEFSHPVPKGFLLHGPPGCGKTLLGRATAWNLNRQIARETGQQLQEFFLQVKGPEILNMWLGESERQVRDLFAQCRKKASEGHLCFLFIDEAESILGTRTAERAGTNILNTLVPMFCTELDGIEPLHNIVVILASNRADLIDPAILRPGRIDRKIRVQRPNRIGARAIYRIYLDRDFPLADDIDAMADSITEAHFSESAENRFLEVSYVNGRREQLLRGDLISGAVIESIVERAKELAIHRTIDAGETSPVTLEDLKKAIDLEYEENELFPPTSMTEDWLKLTDFEPGSVVDLTPYRKSKREGERRTAI
jgi:proteasome-associated ATPase